jgi:adenosylhomocysteine nucleosidase
MIGIVGAMTSEVRRLNDELENAAEETVLDLSFCRGRLCGHDVVVARCGAGKVNAAACTQAMILRYAPRLIVNLGVAGSLNTRLGLLDIAVGRDAVQHDVETKDWGGEIGYRSVIGSVVYPCDGETREAILSAARALGFRALPVRVASGDQFVSDPVKKKEIADFFPRRRVRHGIRRGGPYLHEDGSTVRRHSRHLRRHGRRASDGIQAIHGNCSRPVHRGS